ncbi:MAG: hypothetical protein NVSMB6_13530 [Burkholderiaceae bacterium]
MRAVLLSLLLLGTVPAAHAEGNYDPFSSKNPVERANAAHMRDAIEKGDWALARTSATTPALEHLYDQARREYVPAPMNPLGQAAGKDARGSHQAEHGLGR